MSKTDTLTKTDIYRREVAHELSIARRELREVTRNLKEAKEDLKDLKDREKAAQLRVNDLSQEIDDIESGNYTPRLFEGNGAARKPAKPENEEPVKKEVKWGDDPIDALTAYGMVTAKGCELLQKSELDINTVSDFARAVRTDPLWHRKVSGVGPKIVDKFTDSLQSYIGDHPVPDEPDGEKSGLASGLESGLESGTSGLESEASGLPYPDRNDPDAPDGEFTAVNRKTKAGNGWSVQLATGLCEDQTWRSCLMCTIDDETGGRDTPRVDSEPHPTEREAAHAALSELVDAWGKADGKRAVALPWVTEFRDEFAPETDQSAEDEPPVPEATPVEE